MAKTEKNIAEQTKLQENLEKKILKLKDASSEKDKKSLKRYKEKLSVNKDFLKLLEKELASKSKISNFDKKRNLLLSKAKQVLGDQVKAEDKILKSKAILTKASKITNAESVALLTNIEEKEKEILGSMNEKGILSYDVEETQKEITALTEQLVGLNKKDTIILGKRIAMLQGEHEIMTKTSEEEQAKNKLLNAGLGTMGKSVGALKSMAKGAKAFALAIKANPIMAIAAVFIAIIGYIVKAATATRDMSKDMGVSMKTSLKMQVVLRQMLWTQGELKVLGRDIEDSAKAIFTITRSTRDVNKENVRTLGLLAAHTGATEENVAKLARMFSDINGMDFKGGLALVTATKELSAGNMVDTGLVIADMADSAEEFAAYSKGISGNFAKATIQAIKMGTSIATTIKMTESLLDFENSITATMEASMMIGRNLNFDKARMLAMDNDILGATNELVRQLGTADEFNKLGAIQRKSLAASIGVEVSELSRLISGKKIEMTADQKAQALQKSQLTATEKNTQEISKLNRTLERNVLTKGEKPLAPAPTPAEKPNEDLNNLFKRLEVQ